MKSSSNLSSIALLIFISILTKVFILLAPVFIPHTGLDPYDFQYFFSSAQQVMHGVYPPNFNYPLLALIPMVVSYVCSFGNFSLFSAVFQFLMCICDAVTIACIYMIGLKFLTRQQSFIAGLLYALSLPVAYFSLTKFDSLPAAILMLAIYFTIYGKANKGEWTSIFGACTKIYPIIAFPFLSLYNREKGTLGSLLALWVGAISVVVLLFHKEILSFMFRQEVYVNTLEYMYYLLSHETTSLNFLSCMGYVYLALAFLVMFYIAYQKVYNDKCIRALLFVIGGSILATSIFMPYHSPQYFMWYAPIFCLLVADSVYATFAFCAVSMAVYLEFPLFYNVLYQNDKFLVSWAPWFFIMEWVLMFVMVLLVVVRKKNV